MDNECPKISKTAQFIEGNCMCLNSMSQFIHFCSVGKILSTDPEVTCDVTLAFKAQYKYKPLCFFPLKTSLD